MTKLTNEHAYHASISDHRTVPTSYDELIFPAPTEDQLREADLIDAAAARHRAERARSQDRSDTDGFISQWASGLSASMNARQASILRDGGVAAFHGLFRNGRRVKAKLVTTKFGPSWVVLDSSDNAREWIPASVQGTGSADDPIRFGPRTKGAKLGYQIGYELAPAKAEITGSGYGLSGQAWVMTRRLDPGYPQGAIPFDEFDREEVAS